MKGIRLGIIAALVTGAVGAACVGAWLKTTPSVPLALRTPGRDRPGGVQATQPTSRAAAPAEAIPGPGTPAEDIKGDWSQFRGPARDNVYAEDVFLAETFPPAGPKVLWKVQLGEGYAGAAVRNGRVYVHDYDRTGGPRRNGADTIRCLSLADGQEIWRYAYGVKIKRFHGMTRTVPAVTDEFLVAMGPKCQVTCLDAKTGRLLWPQIDLVRDYGTTVPPWYAGQCPLIDRGRAILAPGGPDVLMMAVDCKTGQTVWTTPNPRGWKMTHSSILPVEFHGKRMYVYCADKGVVAVDATDGTLLWQEDTWRIKIANIPSPVWLGDGRIFLTGGYDAGSLMLKLTEIEGRLGANVLFRLPQKTFGTMQQTPVWFEGYLYGVRADGQLTCLDAKGRVIWTSGASDRFGLGPLLVARGGLLYVMDDNGTLTLARATPAGYTRLARARVLSGHESWGPMALAGGRLIVRDLTTMICLDVIE